MTVHSRPKRGRAHHSSGEARVNPDSAAASKIILFEIALQMKKANLPKVFIVNATKFALDFEGIADLMNLWKDEKDLQEKDEIIADIQDMLDACEHKAKVQELYIKFNDLDSIAKNIRLFKDSLISVVDQNGGIKYLSQVTSIPQPSLSRFFNSNSMPQRSTLLKIAKGLELDEIKMDRLWRQEPI